MRNKLAICAILILLPVILYAQTIRNTRLAQLNQVIYADVMIGAGAGAKITNCFAELPSTGGTCDARGLEGVQSATTTIAVPDDVSLLLGATTLTISADPCYTVGNSSAILGLGQGKTNLLCSSTTGTGIRSVDNTTTKIFPVLRGFSLLASGTHTTSRGIDWTGLNTGRIEDVEIANFGTQLFLDDNATSGTHYSEFNHLYIRASNAASGFDGLEIRRTSNANKFYSLRFGRLDKQIILGNASESEVPNELLFVGTTMELADTVSLEILRAISVDFIHGRFESNAIAIRAAADSLIRHVKIDSPHFSSNTTDIDDSSAGLIFRNFGDGSRQGYQSGMTNEAAPNLIVNALMEGWNGTADLLGWTSLTTTNWDTTGNETQESTIIQSGSFGVRAGDGTNASRGIATPDIIDIDPTKPYTLKFNWTTPNTTNGNMRYGFRLLDSSDMLITTGTVVGIGLTASGSSTSSLTHSASFNAHIVGANLAPAAANTMEFRGNLLKFPTGVDKVRFGIFTFGGAAPDRFVYVDDVYFAEGIASLRGEDKKIGDSGDQTLHGTFKPDAITTGLLNNVRIVDGVRFTTIQLALDDAGAVVVVVPDNYGGAEETSIGNGQVILDFRNGNMAVRARRTTTGTGEALLKVFEGANLSTTNPAANARVGIYAAVQATETLDAWGLNPLVRIEAGVSASVNGIEVNVNNRSNTAGGTAVGIHIVGESTAQADGAFRGINIGEAGITNDIRWKEAILINTGASDLGIVLNPLLTGNNQGSQAVRFVAVDSGGTSRTALILANAAGDLFFQPAGTTALQLFAAGGMQIRSGVRNNGSGFKHARIASGTTAASLHATASATWTFTTAFADTNYTITCTVDNPTGVPLVANTDTKAAGSINIVIMAGSAAAASGTLNCIAVHD